MTEQQMQAFGPALGDFLERFLFCCSYTQTFVHMGTYVKGLLSDLPRKSVEPIALQAGTPVRTLQEFLRDHSWDQNAVRDQLQRQAAKTLAALPDDGTGTVGLIDETSVVKQGKKTPGVHRQYLGCVGKVQNGIVTVHLGLCKGRYKSLIDAELYLPQCWSDDRPRCREAGIPDEMVYRPKWQIALEQIDRARGNGVHLDWLTFDEEYGKAPGFLFGLSQRQMRFVGEVPLIFSCLAVNRRGDRPQEQVKGRKAEEVVRQSSQFLKQPWQVVRLTRQTLQEQAWRVKAARVWLKSEEGWSAASYWLIWASNDETGEEKYFLSNAAEGSSLEVLLRVAFRRYNVEHSFRVCKSELGFGHFEGRSYVALLRHLSLCLMAMGFVAEHTEQLRGGKPRADAGAGVPGTARDEPSLAEGNAADQRVPMRTRNHRLSPGTQSGGTPCQATQTSHRANTKEAPTSQAQTSKQMYGSITVAL